MHRHVNPPSLLDPVGFSHAVVAAPGATVHLGGQTGHHPDGSLDDGLLEQFRQALRNTCTILAAVDARSEDMTSMQVYVTDAAAYRAVGAQLGQIWRSELGRHYPAMALFEVTGLYDPDAQIELLTTLVIPDSRSTSE